MLLFFIAFLLLCARGLRLCPAGQRWDALSREQTTALRGLFAGLIFLSHLRDYIPMVTPSDLMYVDWLNAINQSMVAVFFFYSGYGVFLSYRRREDYDRSFFRKRLLRTWFHFAVAVGGYALLNAAMGSPNSLWELAVALTGWRSIGNSNWFMFVTFGLYGCCLLAFGVMALLCRWQPADRTVRSWLALGVTAVLILAFTDFLRGRQGSWWYNTLWCFPAGALLSLVKEPVERALKGPMPYLAAGILGMVLLRRLWLGRLVSPEAYNRYCVLLMLMLTWLTMKVKITGRPLLWLGKYSFFLYIYMRLPMRLLAAWGVGNKYVFTLLALAASLALAWIMEKVQKRLDKVLRLT